MKDNENTKYETSKNFEFKPDLKTTKTKIDENETHKKTLMELGLLIEKKNLIIDALCEKIERDKNGKS